MKKSLRLSVIIALLGLFTINPPNVQADLVVNPIWVTPLEMDFGPVGLGYTSPQLIATIKNVGSTPITGWSGGGVSSPFQVSQDCNIGGGLLPGESCHYYFTFSPTTSGPFTATSTTNTDNGQFSIIVHGTGVGASVSYDAHSLDFGNNYTSGRFPAVAPTQVVTITNTGLAPITDWAGGAVSAPFGASQDCNISGGVLPGHSCHYFFSFSTSGIGSYSATSTSTTNGGNIDINLSGSTHALILIGGGQKVTPLSLDFGPVGINNATPQLEVAITNMNTSSNITGWAGGGVGAPFNGSQDCNTAGGLAPNSTCHFYYTFHPTSSGVFTATSTVSDSLGSFSIQLQGTGVAPTVKADALWLDFGPVMLGSNGTQQMVTITNTGLSPLTDWAGGGVSAPFNGSQDCNIPGGVQPGDSCHFYYTYSPTVEGNYSTTSVITSNAGTISIKLQGSTSPTYGVYLPEVLN